MSASEPRRERRRDTAAHIRAVLDGALDAVIGMDATGRLTFWNPRAEQMFGWSREEALGQVLADLIIPEANRKAHRAGLEAFLRTGRGPLLNRLIEVTAVRRDGAEFPVELAITAVQEGGYHTFNGFLRDITQRKQDESERERLLAESESAREEAEAASQAKDQFLSTLSHELRTPLTSIVGWAYLLRSQRLDPADMDRGLATIERNAMLQAQVISDILDVSRIQAARFQLHVRPVQLSPLIAAAIESLQPAARAKGVRVQPVLDPSAGPVLGDPDRLQQVVWNLLSNAIKFTEAGGRVQVGLSATESHARITVEDTGIGIPPDFLPHVFELFRQRDSSNTRAHGGMGLGLSVVRHLVELHGGQVGAESGGEGKGAIFTVTLPLLRAGTEAEAHRDAARAAEDGCLLVPDPGALAGLKVVLADADPEVREIIAGILQQCGAQVTAAASAEQALDALVRVRPDVLLSAIELPDQSGYALLRKVRSLPPEAGGRTAAAALSGRSRIEDRVQSLRAGFQMHMAKPVQPAELVAAVASLAGRISAS